MNPAPKIALTRFGAGVHSSWKAEKDLPVGIAVCAANVERCGCRWVFCRIAAATLTVNLATANIARDI
jgi:hypothetical protein